MTVAQSVSEILRDHVTPEVEGIDRMYLNAVIPVLQSERGIAWYFRELRGFAFASSALMAPMTRAFVEAIEDFARSEGLDVVSFGKGQRKDDVAAEYRARFGGEEGVLFLGKAQEKAPVFRTERRKNPKTGASYAWLYRSTAMVNQYYFYAIDRDFGPFFLKFCSYFPYDAKLCINGHEYAKPQLDRRGIRYEALDDGILSCEEPAVLQRICDELSAEKIDSLLREVASPPIPPLFGPGPCRRDPIWPVDSPGGVFAYAGPRSTGDGADLLRGGRPREPRHRPSRSGAAHLRAQDPPEGGQRHPGAVPDPRHHRRRLSVAPRGLQNDKDQAVPQGRPRPTDGDNHQQHLGLRYRQAAARPSRTPGGRLSSQQTSARRPTFFTRSYDRILRPGLAAVPPDQTAVDSSLRASFRQIEHAMTSWAEQAKLASSNLIPRHDGPESRLLDVFNDQHRHV